MKGKKYILAGLCVAAAMLCGCNAKGGVSYDELNKKLDGDYSKVVLTVKDEIDAETALVSEYAMTFSESGTTVTYKVERFAEVSIDFAVREKTTLEGEATIAGGEVSYVRGEKVNLDALAAGGGLNFKKEYFENAELTDSSFRADVKDANGFMGSELGGTQVKVEASFADVFQSIRISYVAASGNRVDCLYMFYQ